MKGDKVYVDRMHSLATEAATGSQSGAIDAYGMVTLDGAGNVIRVDWGWLKP